MIICSFRAAILAATLPIACLAGALGPTFSGAAVAQIAAPSATEKAAASRALAAAERRNWADARNEAARHPLLAKVVAWIEYTTPGSRASFEEISAFLRANPDWPSQAVLRRVAEEALTPEVPDSAVLAWFAGGEPGTTQGRMRLIAALNNSGRREEAVAYLRKTWIQGNFGTDQEKEFLKLYRAHLRTQDHEARIDRLLWDGRGWEAERILKFVSPSIQALAQARIQLRGLGSAVDAAVRKVPKNLVNDPGLIYERVRWRRRKDRDVDARELLAKPPKNLIRPDAWWAERAILARRALRTGEASVAYDLVGKQSQASGIALAESEWLAGWIALRFLGDPNRAYKHFVRLHENVRYPVSLSRGAYWAARAAEAKKDEKLAQEWYGKAAQHVTTFYGQLAAAHLGSSLASLLPQDPAPQPDLRKTFAGSELARVAKLLAGAEDRRLLRSFIIAMADQAKTPEEQELVSELAIELARPDLAVSAARFAVRRGVQLVSTGYPTKGVPMRANGLERELLLALMRQESAFDIEATSSAGARGLMQLMPSTARGLAKQIGVPYAPEKLTSDPEYNVNLGSHYLADLIDDFDGSYVMAIAAYNAGPGRVRAWIRAYGDPRTGALDIVDWIELIPFDETRNYVQRVLENLQVYRTRLAESRVALSLRDDLERPRRSQIRN